MNSENFIEVRNLKKYFEVSATTLNFFRKDRVHSVDGVDFEIKKGETLALVGESGCGKTTLGRCILRLIEPTFGTILFEGLDITNLEKGKLRKLRKDMQIIFQDPFSSLDPRMRIGDIVAEPLSVFEAPGGKDKEERAAELLDAVGLESEIRNRFPHEFSGGQRARIAIARALVLNPKFIIADEPVSSLDVSIKAQILNLLKQLKKDFNLTYLYISHDLSTVKFISDKVAVMYLGKIVETGPVQSVFNTPQHPYTQALMSSVPVPNPSLRRKRLPMKGEPPNPIHPPSGCRFHDRCSYSMQICGGIEPNMVETEAGHKVACYLHRA